MTPLDPVRREALEQARGLKATPAHVARVTRVCGDEAARWAFEQWSLRERARSKFARAEDMLFTRGGLEMATHERVAAWRASRFPAGALVQDLTCGVGADLVALAARGPAEGCDLDPVALQCAAHNLTVHGLRAQIALGDAVGRELGDYAFADPARRSSAGRTLDPGSFSPDPALLAERFRTLRLGAVKLSPMLRDDYLDSLGPEVVFVSHRGECCEAVVFCGSEARPGRWAVHVESGAVVAAEELYGRSDEPLAWLHEADPAAARAHALGSLGHGLLHLGDAPGYLTSDSPCPGPWLRSYPVLWSGPYRTEKVEAALRVLGATVQAVKKRGVPVEPEKVRLKPGGPSQAVLVLYPAGRKVRAVVVGPPESPASPRHS